MIIKSILLISVLFAAGSNCLAFSSDDKALATVDGRTITLAEFTREMSVRGSGDFFLGIDRREALLDELVRNEVTYQTAVKAGYEKRPDVKEAIKRLIVNQYVMEQLEPELADITVGDEEILYYYEGHPLEFSYPEQLRVALIKLSIPSRAPPEKIRELNARAEEAREKALKLEHSVKSFGPVAVNYSDDQTSRYRGGDAGLIKAEAVTKHFENNLAAAILALNEPGEISPVIRSSDAFYIIRLMEVRKSALRPYEEVKEIIRARLFSDKRNSAAKRFFANLSGQFIITRNGDLLKTMKMPGAGVVFPPPLPR